jgi:AcrR family transcriptional regulator
MQTPSSTLKTMRPVWTAVNKYETVSVMSQTNRSPQVEPRQKRALRTRDALLEAVERLVAAEGHAAVTTTRLAVETGVAVGTIYRYFADRDALLLAAYDSTVLRIVTACADQLEALPYDMPAAEAAQVLLARYLEAAEAVPAHIGLLLAMRAIRPIEADQQGENQAGIMGNLILPFLARFAPDTAAIEPAQLSFISVLIGTMVDLYLVTRGRSARAAIMAEMAAHVALIVERLQA